jgi:hypothetical protein
VCGSAKEETEKIIKFKKILPSSDAHTLEMVNAYEGKKMTHLKVNAYCEISNSHGGESELSSGLYCCVKVDNHFTRQYNPEDSSEH